MLKIQLIFYYMKNYLEDFFMFNCHSEGTRNLRNLLTITFSPISPYQITFPSNFLILLLPIPFTLVRSSKEVKG